MDSELYIFDGSSSSSSICHHSSSTEPDMFSSDTTTTTTTIDLFSNNPYLNPIDDQSLNFFDNFTPTTHHLLSSSPPLSQLQTLNLSHTNIFPSLSGFQSFDAVKTEHPMFNSSVMEDSSSFQNQNLLNSPENSFLSDHMRRVYSTGDLQNLRMETTGQRSNSSPLGVESSWTTPFSGEDQSLKVGRYSAQERQEKISKYRAKRTQRNFTKTIKYACRKTLADNRPRVRGRFARNDEVLENPKIASSFTIQEDDDLWNLDGVHEEEEAFMSSFVECQSQPQRQMQYTTTSFW